jgi:hypothetical protein
MSCKNLSLRVAEDATLKVNTRFKKVKSSDPRPKDILNLARDLLRTYYNVHDFEKYFNSSELAFNKDEHWWKLETLSATFGRPPM